ncbi:MAG: hypothetical protein VB835_16795 [Pirellulales bacterium]
MYVRLIRFSIAMLVGAAGTSCFHSQPIHVAPPAFVAGHSPPTTAAAESVPTAASALAASPPLFVSIGDSTAVWQATVDVVDDFFRIKSEQPVGQAGGLLVEGLIETHPLTGATFFEPWRADSIGTHDRLESTLQSIRRIAYVRVIPDTHGYWIDVRVDKELEDVQRPEHATSGVSAPRYEQTIEKRAGALAGPSLTLGWISQGRDILLEQEIQRRLKRYLSPLLLH